MEWNVALTNLGSTTIQTRTGTFEADKTYYHDAAPIRSGRSIDLTVDRAPDLVVEVDITPDTSKKLRTTYAAAAVSEVWRYTLAGFTAYAFTDGVHEPIETSRVVAGLPIAQIAARLDARDVAVNDIVSFRLEWQRWLRMNKDLHA